MNLSSSYLASVPLSLALVAAMHATILSPDRVSRLQVQVDAETACAGECCLKAFDASGTAPMQRTETSRIQVSGSGEHRLLTFEEPSAAPMNGIRLEFPGGRGAVRIYSISLRSFFSNSVEWNPKQILESFAGSDEPGISTRLRSGAVELENSGPHAPAIASRGSLAEEGNSLRAESRRTAYLVLAAVFGVFILLFNSLYRLRALAVQRGERVVWRDAALAAGFMLVLAIPPAASIWKRGGGVNSVENRKLAERPALTWSRLGDFPDAFEKFFDDNVAFRQPLIDLDSRIKLAVFGVSPNSKSVIGKQGWIYYKAEEAHDGVTIDDYRGLVRFEASDLARIKKQLEAREEYCSAHHIPVLTFVCPNKDTAYPEYLPDCAAKVHQGTRLDQLESYLAANSKARIFDLRPAIAAAKTGASHSLYHEAGTHWNYYGAYFGYAAVFCQLSKEVPGLRPHPVEDYDISVHPHSMFDSSLPEPVNTYVGMSLRPEKRGAMGPKLGKVVVFGDSFSEYLLPFLEDHFEKVVAVTGKTFDASVVEREKPDVVLSEVVERFMNHLLVGA